MLAEIITIGDEILIGQVVDTNSAWLGQQLSFSGIQVAQITSVSDDAVHIREALDAAKKRADLILLTGGLGQTNDDITKKSLCEYFGMEWRMDEKILADVEGFFKRFGRAITEVNRLQARVPAGCIALQNKNGTAPGMWFDVNGKVFVSLPGVPYEMKGIFSDSVLPMLHEKFKLPVIIHRTILTQGIGESVLAEKIARWEESLSPENISLAYLPAPGLVRLRLSATGTNREEVLEIVNKKVAEVLPIINNYVYGFDNETLEEVAGKLLFGKNATVATAESCTGGYLAHLITAVPGSSAYFSGSVVAYTNAIKQEILGVPPLVLQQHSAYSAQTASHLATGVKQLMKTTYGIGVTGIAGPGGGTDEKPVGTVWVAVAGPEGVVSKKFQFGDNRERNIIRASLAALALLRKVILGEN